MARWLLKSDPSSWSWQQQVAAGAAGTSWNGVRNPQAQRHLMAMKVGEEAFFYHSNEGKEIVGIVKVTKPFYPDPTDASGKFGMVDVAAVKPFTMPVSLASIKREPKLAEMVLVTNSRLSVQPVSEAEWEIVSEMGGA